MFKKTHEMCIPCCSQNCTKTDLRLSEVPKNFSGGKTPDGAKTPDSHLQGEGREREEGRSLGRGGTGKGKRGAVGGRRVREKE